MTDATQWPAPWVRAALDLAVLASLTDGAITLTATATITDNDGDTATDSASLDIGANLSFAGQQDFGQQTLAIVNRHATLAQDAQLRWALASVGAELHKSRIDNRLVGRGSGRGEIAVGEGDLPRGAVEARRRRAQAPLGVEGHEVRQGGGLGRDLAREHVLGEMRPVVGPVRLGADEGEMAGKARPPQGLGTAKARERGAHHHDPFVRAHAAASAGVSTWIAWTGQATRARSMASRAESAGAGS